MESKFNLQADQYRFPYHWLPILTANGEFSTGKSL